jgi:hypothetical protein
MRKRFINQDTQDNRPADQIWLNLAHLAQVEVTSEDSAYPIESALIPGAGAGWRASQPGRQTIRLLFDEPQKIKRILLLFREDEQELTQEFVLRWSADEGRTYRELVRQQYNFSPPASVQEEEDYRVDLDGVTALEIVIIPDISGGGRCASLAELKLG